MIKGAIDFLKSLFVGKAEQQSSEDPSQSLKQRTIQAVASADPDPIHKGPRGGLYRLDARGRKIYLRQSSSSPGKSRPASRRRQKTSEAS